MKTITNLLKIISPILLLIILGNSLFSNNLKPVLSGADLLFKNHLDLVKGKSLGIVTNHTAILQSGTHLIDSLNSVDSIKISALFGPEHGIRGNAPDGKKINNMIDPKTGIKIFSLYGKHREPTKEMLEDTEMLIFDIQDIGARFYTYISTLFYTLNAASKYDIPVLVLDRPNPINGINVEGPLIIDSLKSFVGIAEIPIRHGMTIGEIAIIFNEFIGLPSGKKADLNVITMQNWKRKMFFSDTGLKWINPSPNMISEQAAVLYPGLCFLEGTNISEGRGTYEPFIQFGAPFINSNKLISELEKLGITQLKYKAVKFTPVAIEGMSTYPKYKNVLCNGVKLEILNKNTFKPVEFGIQLLSVLQNQYPDQFKFKENNWINKLFGDTYLKEIVSAGKSPLIAIEMYKNDLQKFNEARKKYLLY